MEEKEGVYEAIIPKEYVQHPQYSLWIRMFEEKFLHPFNHLRKVVDGSIVYSTGSEHPLKNVSPVSNGELRISRKKIIRIKCTCNNPRFILKKCGKCINCCNDPSCSHAKRKQRVSNQATNASNQIHVLFKRK